VTPAGDWVDSNPSGARPIIVLGDSNAAANYVHIVHYPSAMQRPQVVGSVYKIYCHQGEGGAALEAQQDTFARLQPLVANSDVPRGSWVLDLAESLLPLESPLALINTAWGGSTLDYCNPEVNPSGYATFLAWIEARLALLPSHLEPVVICYEGTNGPGTDTTWSAGMAHIMAALRTDLGYANLGVVVVRIPASAEPPPVGVDYDTIRASQTAYVASDEHSRLAYHEAMTFVDNNTLVQGYAAPSPEGAAGHWDRLGARTLAIGPNATGVTRSILTCIQELLAP